MKVNCVVVLYLKIFKPPLSSVNRSKERLAARRKNRGEETSFGKSVGRREDNCGATGASEVKEVEDELSERCIEGSGIFLIWADRPIMMNSVLEGLRGRRLDDIH